METDELCLFLEGGGGLAAKNPDKCPATTEKEAQQDRSATQDARQGEDTQYQSSDLGAVADVALGVVPDNVGLVVDLVEELVRDGRRERSADDCDDGTAAPGEDGARTALRQRLRPGGLGVARLEEGVNVAQAGRCQLRGGVYQQRYLPVASRGRSSSAVTASALAAKSTRDAGSTPPVRA